eukprot:TRINITY_DN502_c0_g1_i3.p1 TRINITY_DN502_c0_g1~~TRINITY_DN502_c0_g1_i3.p1  ORF type:complete len:662 (+),score=92.45 TRINITY_DN502_c0_g1_i3:68-2053(+)
MVTHFVGVVAVFVQMRSLEAAQVTRNLAVIQAQHSSAPDLVRLFASSNRTSDHIFVDIAAKIFPPAWYKWNHVGYPRRYAGTPVFADFNNDDILDFFYHNHYQMFPEQEWDVGLGLGGARDKGGKLWTPIGEQIIVSTEEPDTQYTELPIDTHGTAILDIDGDGILDMYIATGGGMGQDTGPKKNAVVMWGEPAKSSFHGMSYVFKGGRKTAEDFGLHNPDSRGRFTYFADFNRDGLLDIVFSNEARLDQVNAFGYALINEGNRTFETHLELSEYASTMILTDADLDGRAEEFVVQRAECLPKGDKAAQIEAPTPTVERSKFCETRPVGSTAIYKFDTAKNKMTLISPHFSRSKNGDETPAASMQTADFDGDLKADLAVLYEEEIRIYLSSKRKPGELPVGPPDDVIKWHAWWGENPCLGRALRVADLNLDGKQELIVLCAQFGGHLLWQRSESNEWVSRRGDVGDLQDTVKPQIPEALLETECTKSFQTEIYLADVCSARLKGTLLPESSAYGMAVVDWNNDGYMDITLTHDVGGLMMLRNTWGTKTDTKHNQFLAIKLHGRLGNAYGIGATVLLTARNVGSRQERTTQFREIVSASHETDWWGSKEDRIVFGLGQFGVPEKLEIRWPAPGGGTQVFDEATLRNKVNKMHSLFRVDEPET